MRAETFLREAPVSFSTHGDFRSREYLHGDQEQSSSQGAIRIGLLGCGTVGSSVARILLEERDALQAEAGLSLELTRVAVLHLSKPRPVDLPEGTITSSANDVIHDPRIDVVIEVIGGIDPPKGLIADALRSGKSVITANKELLAAHGEELFSLASAVGSDLHFEASVCGAVPIVRTLRESLAGQRIDRVVGIVNGTTNYVLSRMTKYGSDQASALREAQELGFAERDPSADIEGLDAAAKAAILVSLVFGIPATTSEIETKGITYLTSADLRSASRLGYVIKPVAVAERVGDRVAVGVGPALVPEHHPISQIEDQFNGILVEARDAGHLMFYGPGAGGDPTASAIIADLLAIARGRLIGGNRSRKVPPSKSAELIPLSSSPYPYFLRIQAETHPYALRDVDAAVRASGVNLITLDVERRPRGFLTFGLITEPLSKARLEELCFSLEEAGYSPCDPLPVLYESGSDRSLAASEGRPN